MPAYTRLEVDERRRRLLELGADLFTRHAYDELSMADIARAAGISKGLLYHYFPSKQAYFMATLQDAAGELEAAVRPAPLDTPAEQLAGSLGAYLAWVDEHAVAYAKLMRSVSAVPEVREVVDGVRDATATAILAALTPTGPSAPAVRTAVRAWLWFADGAILDWLEHRDLHRDALHGLLTRTLWASVAAAHDVG